MSYRAKNLAWPGSVCQNARGIAVLANMADSVKLFVR